ncbi:hypothetical protein D477_010986, partial [Arthrobacter crystallopoietes BAB-32]
MADKAANQPDNGDEATEPASSGAASPDTGGNQPAAGSPAGPPASSSTADSTADCPTNSAAGSPDSGSPADSTAGSPGSGSPAGSSAPGHPSESSGSGSPAPDSGVPARRWGPRPVDPFSVSPPWEDGSWAEGELLDEEGIPIDPPDTPIPLHVLTGHDAPPEEDPWADQRNEPLPASQPPLPATSGQVKDLLTRLAARDPSRMHYKEAAHELVAIRRIGGWLEAYTLRLLTALTREALNEQPHGWPHPLGPDKPDR